jgi:repressor LexA
MKPPYTARQGQYLAYIHHYATLHGRPPAEAELAHFFQVTPPSVHLMILTLERRGFITRVPGHGGINSCDNFVSLDFLDLVPILHGRMVCMVFPPKNYKRLRIESSERPCTTMRPCRWRTAQALSNKGNSNAQPTIWSAPERQFIPSASWPQ